MTYEIISERHSLMVAADFSIELQTAGNEVIIQQGGI